MTQKKPRAREGEQKTDSQTGIARTPLATSKGESLTASARRQEREVATNEVNATSRDHAKLRVETPLPYRPLQPAASMGYDTLAAGGMDLGPKYRL